MKIWIVSMECAGIIEAGGVKNVTYSLCKEFALLKHDITLFIPVYKTNEWSSINNFKENLLTDIPISHCGKEEKVSYSTGYFNDGNFKIVFVNHPVFSEKEAVYTYTENESRQNPEHQKGKGHVDTLFSDSLFAKSVIAYGNLQKKEIPDIIHCQDASTALVPAFGKENSFFAKTKYVVTIHNAGPAYHHNFSSMGEAFWYTGLKEDLLNNSLNDYGNYCKIEPFLIAHNSGAYLTTVSETYAKELADPFYNAETEGLSTIFFTKKIQIKGITNGIDVDRYNPTVVKESLLPYPYNPKTLDLDGKILCREEFIRDLNDNSKSIPDTVTYGKLTETNDETIYIAYHGRITHQKGLNVLLEAIPAILCNYKNVKFLIMGQGDTELENEIIKLTSSYFGKICFINGYERTAARMTTAICDFIVLPSFFEPCGLEDFIAQIFGTVPIAHKTGGLNKIINEKTGFLYTNNTHEELIAKLSEVITIKKHNPKMINNIIKNAYNHVCKNYLWKNVIKNNYLNFFKEILKNI